MADDVLDPRLLQRVCARLGLPAGQSPSLDGLRTAYAAWCAGVPFDNVRKTIALHEGSREPLPGMGADDFLEAWLAHGAGGTCWAGSNALCVLLSSLGFRARRATGSMRDVGVPNHGTTIVELAGEEWLVDSSMLTRVPLPLARTGREREGAYSTPAPGVEIETSVDGDIVWFDAPPHARLFPCRLLQRDVPRTFHLAAYERSRASSPFNEYLYARRSVPGGTLLLRGASRFVRVSGQTTVTTLDAPALRASLETEFDMSRALVDRWAASGALDACYAPVMGPATAPFDRPSPSARIA
jgi:arylamine N-acetyltransferase